MGPQVLASMPTTADDAAAMQARDADAAAQAKMDRKDLACRLFDQAQANAASMPNLAYASAYALGVLLRDADEV